MKFEFVDLLLEKAYLTKIEENKDFKIKNHSIEIMIITISSQF